MASALRARHRRPWPRGAPALERGPDPPFQPESVERRRRTDGADAVEADPGPLEAAFLQHASRRRVADARPRMEGRAKAFAKRVVDERAGGLGRIAIAPERYTQPIADLRDAVA